MVGCRTVPPAARVSAPSADLSVRSPPHRTCAATFPGLVGARPRVGAWDEGYPEAQVTHGTRRAREVMRTPTTYRGSAEESGERFAGPGHEDAAASSVHRGGEDADDRREPAASRDRRDADPGRTRRHIDRSDRFGSDG